MTLRVVVAYDVSDGDQRARLAAMLSAWGDRIQRSVFECTLGEDRLAELVERAGDLIDLDRDVLQVFPQCASCHGSRLHLGQARALSEDPYWIV